MQRIHGKSMNFKGWKKIWRIIESFIWTYLICGLAFSLGYAHFCKDKIQAREQYLIDVSKTIPPPSDVVYKEKYMLRKFVFRKYYLKYTYEQSGNKGIEYYKGELKKNGYAIKKLKEDELEATNGDILIYVGYSVEQKDLTVAIMLDDIFQSVFKF